MSWNSLFSIVTWLWVERLGCDSRPLGPLLLCSGYWG